MKNTKSLRIVFQELLDGKLTAKTPENQVLCLHCTESQVEEIHALSGAVHPGSIFNLLNVSEIEDNALVAEWIVFEPDYLLDISSLA